MDGECRWWWVNADLLLTTAACCWLLGIDLLLPVGYRFATRFGEMMNTDLLPDLLPCGFFFAKKMMETEEWRLESGEAKKENRWIMTTREWIFRFCFFGE
ncbi:hypothetical protein SLEP1_g6791 [Rubroshorea leprosula]|uniref:Uncharacterized protein n=1 Tax=Rubroshorea leprosula TaxID=152421 RepID=A0AAV5HWC2_9ROSI|nr:hypothetical protein SLEP1_g6791 [Rubroshorea leprosula]